MQEKYSDNRGFLCRIKLLILHGNVPNECRIIIIINGTYRVLLKNSKTLFTRGQKYKKHFLFLGQYFLQFLYPLRFFVYCLLHKKDTLLPLFVAFLHNQNKTLRNKEKKVLASFYGIC